MIRFDARRKTNSVSDTTVVPEVCFDTSHRSKGHKIQYYDTVRLARLVEKVIYIKRHLSSQGRTWASKEFANNNLE